jgi:serine/threonine protein kinase
VRLATHIESGKEYAVKIMPLPRPNEAPTDTGATREEIFNEVNILSKLENPNCLLYKVRTAKGG